MDSIISTFHLDWKIMLAQLINFSIVVFVLWFFALKPLSQKMAKRSERIEQGLKNAQNMDLRLKQLEEEKKSMAEQAKLEASMIIQQAHQQAEQQKTDKINKAKEEISYLIANTKKQMLTDQQKIMAETKDKISDLIVLATEKIIQERLNSVKDRSLIEQTVKNLNENNT